MRRDPFTAPDYDRVALITIDVQRDTLDGGTAETPGTSEAIPRICEVVDVFRARRRPIIHMVRLYAGDGSNVDLCRRSAVLSGTSMFLVGSTGAELADGILPPGHRLRTDLLLSGELQRISPEETIVYKPRWGAFFETPLEALLRGLDVSTLVFCGANFPNCPRTSIYEASERDFRIVVIKDAMSRLSVEGIAELRLIGVEVSDVISMYHRLGEDAE